MAKLFTDRFIRYRNMKPFGSFQRAVLWPMNAWRVLVPEQSGSALNIFEEAILGLIKSRCTDVNKIADLLCLSVTLVDYIIQQMVNNGLLTSAMGLTPKGKRKLTEQEELKTSLASGYVFQDIFTGELMPRFVKELQYIDADEYRDGRPAFRRSRGEEQLDSPTLVSHLNAEHALNPPSAYEIIDCIRDHNVAIHNRKLQADEFLDLERMRYDSIEIVDSTPVPVYLWCWLYQKENSGKEWLVTDPTDITPASEWMRNRMSRQLEHQPNLAGTLNQMFGIERKATTDWKAREDEIQESARLELLSEFPGIRHIPLAEKYLLAVIRRTKNIEQNDRVYREDIDSLIGEAQKLVEALFQWVLQKWPAPSAHVRLQGKPKPWLRRDVYQALEIECVPSGLIKKLAGPDTYQVKRALENGQASLKALVSAAALSTCDHQETHPLRKLSKDEIKLIEIMELAELRNPASHASQRKFKKEEALTASETAMHCAKVLSNWV
ncbi:hypothetical protein [Endozoicomonas numazuensis]|uniref:Uncharacterized protein n=1 Tax=Endozoicomonas numazuensis TaxID=1137799 RepID=A0A081NHG4_9GAMM|nr:hypothetical protein [Endozoicomonas numazuensis]KEQ17887.1 hypothetical protein GZ78_09610 [Endozoicomonas numazuensis]